VQRYLIENRTIDIERLLSVSDLTVRMLLLLVAETSDFLERILAQHQELGFFCFVDVQWIEQDQLSTLRRSQHESIHVFVREDFESVFEHSEELLVSKSRQVKFAS
jgi:hypothetical protein